jgi:hypothetical protein
MFVLQLNSKRRQFRHFHQALDHAYGTHSRAVVEWVWDGPMSGHHAIWAGPNRWRSETSTTMASSTSSR